MANFMSNREDPFFEALKVRMVQAAETLREKRLITSSQQVANVTVMPMLLFSPERQTLSEPLLFIYSSLVF